MTALGREPSQHAKPESPDILIHTASFTDRDLDFILSFDRRQPVDRVIRMTQGVATESADPFVDDWSRAERLQVKQDLLNAQAEGGFISLAMRQDRVVGFACVDGAPLDPDGRYRQLKEIHVAADERGRGIGRLLFARCVEEARCRGFQRLYISSHSARETVLFYQRQACVDARWLCAAQIEREPFDYQMEYVVAE